MALDVMRTASDALCSRGITDALMLQKGLASDPALAARIKYIFNGSL